MDFIFIIIPTTSPTFTSTDSLSMAPSLTLPPIQSLPSLSTIERAKVLDLLFEPCIQLHTLSLELLGIQSFASYVDLIASVGIQLTKLAKSPSTSDTAWLDAILGSHPRLGEEKVDSQQSQTEQAHLQTSSQKEVSSLALLNDEYERTFPRLRYV